MVAGIMRLTNNYAPTWLSDSTHLGYQWNRIRLMNQHTAAKGSVHTTISEASIIATGRTELRILQAHSASLFGGRFVLFRFYIDANIASASNLLCDPEIGTNPTADFANHIRRRKLYARRITVELALSMEACLFLFTRP